MNKVIKSSLPELRLKIEKIKEFIAKEQNTLNRPNRIKFLQSDLAYNVKKLLSIQPRYKGNPSHNPNGRNGNKAKLK